MKWSKRLKSLTEKREFGPHALPISAWAKGDTECLLALAGWYNPLTGFCHKLYEITVESQSRDPHLLLAGHFIHLCKHSIELIKYSRKRVYKENK